MARKLRIVVSVFFGLLTVAVVVLWVRSYWKLDSLVRSAPAHQEVSSFGGSVSITLSNDILPGETPTAWRWDSYWLKKVNQSSSQSWVPRLPKFTRNSVWRNLSVPYWTTTAISLILAVAPIYGLTGFEHRFSLRTLLIATTLFAVALGMGAWLAS